jgi:hypothetical protein
MRHGLPRSTDIGPRRSPTAQRAGQMGQFGESIAARRDIAEWWSLMPRIIGSSGISSKSGITRRFPTKEFRSPLTHGAASPGHVRGTLSSRQAADAGVLRRYPGGHDRVLEHRDIAFRSETSYWYWGALQLVSFSRFRGIHFPVPFSGGTSSLPPFNSFGLTEFFPSHLLNQ